MESAAVVRNLMPKTARVMWDSEWYEIPPGGSKIYPQVISDHFFRNYPTIYVPNTDPPEPVVRIQVEMCEEGLELQPVRSRTWVDPETGSEYANYDEFMAALTARIEVEVGAKMAAQVGAALVADAVSAPPSPPVRPQHDVPTPPPRRR